MKEVAEWRTLLAVAICYLLYALLVFGVTDLPSWIRAITLVPVFTFHSSLQHECIHGHPFRRQLFNDLLVAPPIGILVPYCRFKAAHLAHHACESIADPYDDPESWYLDHRDWQHRSTIAKKLFELNNTLLGRIILGPTIGLFGFLRSDIRALLGGDLRILRSWMIHFVATGILLIVITNYGQIDLVAYCFAAYFGIGVIMVRSFLEHQAHDRRSERTVIIEDKGPLSLLFLNNNLHYVHHAHPGLPWYRLPEHFKDNRERFLQMNGHYQYDNYLAIFRKFSWRAKEPVVWPVDRSESRR